MSSKTIPSRIVTVCDQCHTSTICDENSHDWSCQWSRLRFEQVTQPGGRDDQTFYEGGPQMKFEPKSITMDLCPECSASLQGSIRELAKIKKKPACMGWLEIPKFLRKWND